MPFSRKTLARLADAVAEQNSHASLSALFFEYDVDQRDVPDGNLKKRSLAFIRALAELSPEARSRKEIVEVAEKLGSYRWERDIALVAAMRLDGFEFCDGRLIPTTPDSIPLYSEISVLELALTGQLSVAGTHYRQAVNNFTDGHFEASNGQVRSFVEAFLPQLSLQLTGKTSTNVGAALQHLKHAEILDEHENNMLKAFWNGIQDNGPHAGLTSGSEALFRLHSGTAVARYLLAKSGHIST